MPRYLSWLALSVAAGFLVVASVGFAASTVTSLAFGISIVTLIISAGIAYSDRRHKVVAITAVCWPLESARGRSSRAWSSRPRRCRLSRSPGRWPSWVCRSSG